MSSSSAVIYLIDTDVLIYFLRDIPDAVSRVDRLVDLGSAMSAVTYMEIQDGLGRETDGDEEGRRLRVLSHLMPVLPFTVVEARIAGALRRSLRNQNRSVRARALDIQIAATAIANGLILVTNNPSDYRGLPDLQLEPANIHV